MQIALAQCKREPPDDDELFDSDDSVYGRQGVTEVRGCRGDQLVCPFVAGPERRRQRGGVERRSRRAMITRQRRPLEDGWKRPGESERAVQNAPSRRDSAQMTRKAAVA